MSFLGCFNKENQLQILPNCLASTDSVADHVSLMKQRRRWSNGHFFAYVFIFKYNIILD